MYSKYNTTAMGQKVPYKSMCTTMRKLSLFITLVLLVSCGSRNNQVVQNEEKTNPLVEYLQQYKNKKNDAVNDIQRDELWQEREDGIVVLQDSLGVFNNLKGRINNITARDVRNSKVVEFGIEIKPEEYFEITLKCSHIVHKDSLGSDSLYQTVKGLSNYSTVYVDGAIAVTSKGKVANASASWSEKDLQLSYPTYNFNIVSLSTSPLPEISGNLQHAIVMWRRNFEGILKNGKSALTDESIATYKKATESLTPEEDAYLGKYGNACSVDLYRD